MTKKKTTGRKAKPDVETKDTIHRLRVDAYIGVHSTLGEALRGDWVVYVPYDKPYVDLLEKWKCLEKSELYNLATKQTTTIHKITGLGKKVHAEGW